MCVRARDQIEKLKTHLTDLEESNHDLRAEMENCTKREGGHLDFTKKVSDKNARLQSENSSLSNKVRRTLVLCVVIYLCILV